MNPFTGSIFDLAPTTIGKWKLVRTDNLGEITRQETGCTEAIVALYESPIGARVIVQIMKFTSVEGAKEGIAITYRKGMAAGRGSVERVGAEIKTEGGREVGVRYALALRGRPSEIANIRWTNGTVSFLIAEVKAVNNENNNLAFEGAFPGAPASIGSDGGTRDGVHPSQTEIQACVDASQQSALGGLSDYGQILKLQFGTTFTSQGGTIELGMGSPKGTTMLPTKIYFQDHVITTWVFKDSFGTLQCRRIP
jgi:hypothetical protein